MNKEFDQLDALYMELLALGMIVLRQALDRANIEWAVREVEMLHNIPGLVGERNVARHRYYWLQERQAYISSIKELNNDHAMSGMETYYMPIWDEMQKIMDIV